MREKGERLVTEKKLFLLFQSPAFCASSQKRREIFFLNTYIKGVFKDNNAFSNNSPLHLDNVRIKDVHVYSTYRVTYKEIGLDRIWH